MFKKKLTTILLSTLAILGTLTFSQMIVFAAVTNGWEQSGPTWNYYINGNKATGWTLIDGKYYYFNADGHMATGWFVMDGKTYYFNDRNGRSSGWNVIGSSTYYFNSDGVMLTGWNTIDGKKYYFNDKGEMATGKTFIGNKTYCFTATGEMAVGWLLIGDKWYYLSSTGEMEIGLIEISGKTYYFNDNGEMLTGMLEISGKNYFFNATGDMAKGWIFNNSKWYYFYNSGEMARGWVPYNGKWYYLNTDGTMAMGWIQINGKWYYMNNGGDMAVGTITPDGYRVGSDGTWDGKPKVTNGNVYSPTGVTAKALSKNLILINWNKVDNVDYYICYWSNEVSKGYTSFKNADGTLRKFQWQSSGYTITIDLNTRVFFKVTAVKDGIEAAASTVVSSMTTSTTVFPLLSDVPMPLNVNYYKTTITSDDRTAAYYYSKASLSSSFIENYISNLGNNGWVLYTEDITYTGTNSRYFVKGGNLIIVSTVGEDIVVIGNIH